MCSCSEFGDLTFDRSEITKRIKASHVLRKSLSLLATHDDSEHELLQCGTCGQNWQSSRAWNWGNERYLFKVPAVPVEQWLAQEFVQPDELLIFSASLGDLSRSVGLSETESICTTGGCGRRAIAGSVKCFPHHIASLQRAGMFPETPEGHWFQPYERSHVLGPL